MMTERDLACLQSSVAAVLGKVDQDARQHVLNLIREHRDLVDAVRRHHAQRFSRNGPDDRELWAAAGVEPA